MSLESTIRKFLELEGGHSPGDQIPRLDSIDVTSLATACDLQKVPEELVELLLYEKSFLAGLLFGDDFWFANCPEEIISRYAAWKKSSAAIAIFSRSNPAGKVIDYWPSGWLPLFNWNADVHAVYDANPTGGAIFGFDILDGRVVQWSETLEDFLLLAYELRKKGGRVSTDELLGIG